MWGLFAGPVENHEANHLLQLGEAMPPAQLLNVVFTNQAVDGRIAFASANSLNRIDRVRRRRPQQLAFIHFKLLLAFDRRLQHCQSYFAARDRSGLLERGNRRWHQDDFVELERFNRFACENKMRVMDWVEGAAIDRDLLQSPNAQTLDAQRSTKSVL